MTLIAKTNINLSYFSLPRVSLFFDKIGEGTNHPHSHYYYTFLCETDDSFLFDLISLNYKIALFDKGFFVTLNLEQCLELLQDHPKHKNYETLKNILIKDGFEYLLKGRIC